MAVGIAGLAPFMLMVRIICILQIMGVTEAEWAYDIGAGNCVVSRYVTLENNTASNSYFGDFLIGGYAETGFKAIPTGAGINCDPTKSADADEGHGYVENVTVKSNAFNSPAGSPALL